MRDIYLKEFKPENWANMVQIYQERYAQVDPAIRAKVVESKIPKEIQIVLLPDMGEYLLTWMDRKVPALGNETPSDYLKSEEGTKALKAAILRMPR
ncbi:MULTISPECIES: antitoxin Xre/MbcA/ParS toxin-binding domain-containing protein [Paenibacillus]|jgi:hypothetical protein|uniref:DUF2384 domain-containing protein n=2 Tax=Paenibacillus TaxID=44249 RepID=A0A2S6NYN1_9BACL|nr:MULTISPECIES: antitoxin Xre/MbcA/ParS toxin-binding domain-containing protein [Paenibacillus]AIW41046.1 hypothetical protein X809_34195 [Paenibacillus polymyxa CR1]APQ60604.1 hypothetical protein VK72_18695 [Paenibacillus polymyxa]MCP3743881.1 MbcA/ParS/Xre antitoxin family protein [Paenibacillus sp. A3M_27_13]MDR6777130.1 hypothetical protein [Paenibacillus peoriae]MXO79124.1 DUF2384 domain-containing protein [Paenibacillus sp. OT2-17]